MLLSQVVGAATDRRVGCGEHIEKVLREACGEIAKRDARVFWAMGTDKHPVQLLSESVPTYSATKLGRTVKSLRARDVFAQAPEVKKQLWGGSVGAREMSSIRGGNTGMRR